MTNQKALQVVDLMRTYFELQENIRINTNVHYRMRGGKEDKEAIRLVKELMKLHRVQQRRALIMVRKLLNE